MKRLPNSARGSSPAAQSDAEKDFYGHKRACLPNRQAGLDRQIDAPVYGLYLPAPHAARQAGALTPDEIKIMESNA